MASEAAKLAAIELGKHTILKSLGHIKWWDPWNKTHVGKPQKSHTLTHICPPNCDKTSNHPPPFEKYYIETTFPNEVVAGDTHTSGLSVRYCSNGRSYVKGSIYSTGNGTDIIHLFVMFFDEHGTLLWGIGPFDSPGVKHKARVWDELYNDMCQGPPSPVWHKAKFAVAYYAG